MSSPRQLVLGKPPAAPGGIALLAHIGRRHARLMGLPAWIEFSRSHGSASRYLRVLIPGAGFPLKVRISDHLITHAACDFDLVSQDGVQGADALRHFLDQAVRGELG